MHHPLSFIIALAFALSGCATAPEPPATGSDPGALLTLDDGVPPWASWTPGPNRLEATLQGWIAFDGLTPDATRQERLWSVVFAMLSVLRSADAGAEASAHTLMAHLEPGEGSVTSLYFVARRRGSEPAEGVVVALSAAGSGAEQQALVRLHREVGDAGPRRVEAWFEAGFTESVRLGVRLDRVAGVWKGELNVAERKVELSAEIAELLASAAIDGIWLESVGPAYDALGEDRSRPGNGIGGLELGRRDIDEVLSDTRLTPRL